MSISNLHISGVFDDSIRISEDANDGLAWCLVSRDCTEIIDRGKGFCEFPEEWDEVAIKCAKSAKFPTADIDVDENEDVYIRFGALPKGGKSRNWATGEYEVGISCYDAGWDYNGGYWRIIGSGLVGAIIGALVQDMPAYLIKGREIGRGSDGEPCITDASVLCQLSFDTNCEFYEVTAQ